MYINIVIASRILYRTLSCDSPNLRLDHLLVFLNQQLEFLFHPINRHVLSPACFVDALDNLYILNKRPFLVTTKTIIKMALHANGHLKLYYSDLFIHVFSNNVQNLTLIRKQYHSLDRSENQSHTYVIACIKQYRLHDIHGVLRQVLGQGLFLSAQGIYVIHVVQW